MTTMTYTQDTLPDSLPEGYLQCSNPHMVRGYVAIKDILRGRSTDFHKCLIHQEVWCECNLNEKREDESYKLLVKHFANGGMINIPIIRPDEWTGQSNGHHRAIAAMDAGFTHVPYMTNEHYAGGGWEDDWSETYAERYGFKLIKDRWGDTIIESE